MISPSSQSGSKPDDAIQKNALEKLLIAAAASTGYVRH
jgi:hypothetical protein